MTLDNRLNKLEDECREKNYILQKLQDNCKDRIRYCYMHKQNFFNADPLLPKEDR